MTKLALSVLAAALSVGMAYAQPVGKAPRDTTTNWPQGTTSGTGQVGPGSATSPSTGTGGGSQAQMPPGRPDDDINSKSRNGAGPGATTPVR